MFAGGALTLAVPLVLGFAVAGTVIGVAAKDQAVIPFLKLAFSGLGLGILFLGLGLTISTFSRTRVQALVFALLAWCVAVFVFDLAALGALVSTHSTAAAREIEVVCDATHINVAADVHSAFDNATAAPVGSSGALPSSRAEPSLGWLALNPVDLFRAINLPAQMQIRVPMITAVFSVCSWLAFGLGAAVWRLRRTDI